MRKLKRLDRDRIESLVEELKERKGYKAPEKDDKKIKREHSSLFQVLLILFFYLCFGSGLYAYYFFLTHNQTLENPEKEAVSEKYLQSLKQEEQKVLEKLKDSFSEEKVILQLLVEKEPFYLGLFKELSLIIPPEVILSEFLIEENLTKDKVISCRANMYYEGKDPNVLFKKVSYLLVSSPYFSNLRFITVEDDKDNSVIYFDIKGKVVI